MDFLALREKWVDNLGQHTGFVHETRWFDGAILIEVGRDKVWLKIYRGKIIDQFDHTPVFGYTFKVSGSVEAWHMLASGERTFTDLATPGSRHLASYADPEIEGGGYRPAEIEIEGNGFESGRLLTALYHLSRSFAETYGPQVQQHKTGA